MNLHTTGLLILIALIIAIMSSCQIEPYSRYTLKNSYPSNTSLIVPISPDAYISWDSLLTDLSKCQKPIIVIDANRLSDIDMTHLKEHLKKASKLKIHIALKISTNYGQRTIEDIARKLLYFQDLLPEVNAVYFDEVLDNPDMIDYYSNLSVIARELGFDFVIMNLINSNNPELFLEFADALVVYENQGISEHIIPSKEIRTKSIAIVYAQSWQEIIPFINYLRKGLLGKWVFITDRINAGTHTPSNLPSFWKELVNNLCRT